MNKHIEKLIYHENMSMPLLFLVFLISFCILEFKLKLYINAILLLILGSFLFVCDILQRIRRKKQLEDLHS